MNRFRTLDLLTALHAVQSPALPPPPPSNPTPDDPDQYDESVDSLTDPDHPTSGQAVDDTAAPTLSGEIRSGKLAGKSMWVAIWILALPVLVQQTMAACVGLVDKIIAGSLPETIMRPALDGIGVGSYVGWFVAIAMAGLGIGGQALIARAMGSGDGFQSHRALGQAITVSVVWGALVGIVLWVGVYPLTSIAELSPRAADHCRDYVQTLAYFMPFCGVMMVGAMCMHGAGETFKPSAIAVSVNIVNIIFTWLFSGVSLQFGSPNAPFILPNPSPIDPEQFGVIGIALGSGVSFLIGGIVTLWVLIRGVKDLRLEKEHLPFDGSMIWRFVRVGVPNFFEGIAMWAVNLFVIRFIGQIALRQAETGEPSRSIFPAADDGVVKVSDSVAEGLHGAHMIAVQWEAFSFMPGFAIGTAAGALAGQYLGAGNPAKARRAVMVCTAIGAAIMGMLGIVFMLAGELLTSIISHDPIHMQETPKILFICGTIQVFFAINMVVRQALRGVGDTVWVLILTVISSYGVRLPMAYVFGVALGYGLEGIWIGLCLELVFRAMLFAGRFIHGGWKRISV